MGGFTFFALCFLIIGMTNDDGRRAIFCLVIWALLSFAAFYVGEIKFGRV